MTEIFGFVLVTIDLITLPPTCCSAPIYFACFITFLRRSKSSMVISFLFLYFCQEPGPPVWTAGNLFIWKVFLLKKATPFSIDDWSIVMIVIITIMEKMPTTIPSIVRNAVSYTHLRAHETVLDLVCRLL